MKKKEIEKLRKEVIAFNNEHPGEYAMRSCWNCNGAHEHLKDLDIPLMCFDCGHWYLRGVDLMEPEKPRRKSRPEK